MPLELRLHPGSATSFEGTCAAIENEFCRHEHDLVCACCLLGEDAICASCQFAVGFHRCSHAESLRWRKGTLYGIGDVDIQRVFYNLHLKRLPIDVLREKAPYKYKDSGGGGGSCSQAEEYVEAELLSEESAATILRVIESERRMSKTINDGVESDDEEPGPAAPAHGSRRMTKEELRTELDRRTALLQEGAVEGLDTDQWRVYCHIINTLTGGERYLRLLVQASAGTGDSLSGHVT